MFLMVVTIFTVDSYVDALAFQVVIFFTIHLLLEFGCKPGVSTDRCDGYGSDRKTSVDSYEHYGGLNKRFRRMRGFDAL